MNRLSRAAFACATLLFASCSNIAPPASVEAPAPAQWYAPLPHEGSLTDLKQWWSRQGDPLLVELIDAAQKASPTVASAKSRIDQAHAVRTAAIAGMLPELDLAATGTRSNGQPPLTPAYTTIQRGASLSWEIDIFGAGRDAYRSARARYAGARAGWHDARVSVAAEVANQYYALRACEKLAAITQADAASRAETARLSALSAKAGFTAPATDALARASAAEGSSRATQQQAECDIDVKALVALTALPEPELRQKLAPGAGRLPEASPIAIDALPAHILTQRPDIFMAEQEVAAVSGEVGTVQAQRYPRVTLGGFIGRTRFSASGYPTSDMDSWTVGPLSITLPVFDAGRRAANVESARARYDEAVNLYRARVRQAVREVEEALVNLHSTASRSDDAAAAVEGYRASFAGTESRYHTGLASLVELEDSRRTRLVAEISQIGLQRDRLAAWVALYRAAGGGWSYADIEEAGKQ